MALYLFSPGQDRYAFLSIAAINVFSGGNPAVACRYCITFFIGRVVSALPAMATVFANDGAGEPDGISIMYKFR